MTALCSAFAFAAAEEGSLLMNRCNLRPLECKTWKTLTYLVIVSVVAATGRGRFLLNVPGGDRAADGGRVDSAKPEGRR